MPVGFLEGATGSPGDDLATVAPVGRRDGEGAARGPQNVLADDVKTESNSGGS
jgi:hypothetical protein